MVGNIRRGHMGPRVFVTPLGPAQAHLFFPLQAQHSRQKDFQNRPSQNLLHGETDALSCCCTLPCSTKMKRWVRSASGWHWRDVEIDFQQMRTLTWNYSSSERSRSFLCWQKWNVNILGNKFLALRTCFKVEWLSLPLQYFVTIICFNVIPTHECLCGHVTS